jgi:hypothetical protein
VVSQLQAALHIQRFQPAQFGWETETFNLKSCTCRAEHQDGRVGLTRCVTFRAR